MLPKTYSPKEVESKWYSYWLKKKFFHSIPDNREAYTIVIPPPNVTGVLHMGHILNNTIQDVLIRRARMLGKNACWVPGTDHASIATEVKVVALLKEKGIKKSDITREEFLKYAWEWKEKYGGIILEQLKKLGCSCDWERTRFTMEKDMSDAVTDVFIDLYNKGLIYRGYRMVNWDPQGLTAISDEEVNYREVNSKLFYVKYKIENSSDFITIATTRPETILGDTAVCIHPEDGRYKHLKGKKVIIPLVNRVVPVIFDEYVDKEFGTGALKVTPAHDVNDYHLGLKHKLETIDILNPDGSMSPAAKFFVGEDRFVCRKKIVKELDAYGQIVKVEEIKNKVGFSERTDAAIEPRLSLQWFLKMNELSKPALENVLNENIKLIPEKFINTYKHWMENIHDWCISRQLWWGQRIPAWYCDCEECKEVVIVQHEKPEKCPKCSCANHLRQDEDVVDTWFSSWLWPISVFNGFKDPNNPDIKYYYPTNDLVTAPEILFFWVARMIIAGYEYRKEKPFRNVYLTGIVRDKSGRKMSKSLGNSPDPLVLIEKYGADGVRVGMLLCSPAGNDLLFDEKLCEQGRNFCNKIWNAFRLIKGWRIDEKSEPSPGNKIAVDWFDSWFNAELNMINKNIESFRLSDALMTIYRLIWDDFCSSFLEMIKPIYIDGKQSSMDKKTYEATRNFLEKLLKVLHPFMPFITEEIWHHIRERNDEDCITISNWQQFQNNTIEHQNMLTEHDSIKTNYFNIIFDYGKINEGILFARKIRQQYNISFKNSISIIAISERIQTVSLHYWKEIIEKLTHSTILINPNETIEKSNCYFFTGGEIDWYIEKEGAKSIDEIQNLMKEIDYQKNFLQSIQKKLSNEKFIQNAKPEIIEHEKKKQTDAEAKIKALEEQLNHLLNTN